MSNTVASPQVLEIFSGFLKWGPLGLAGLMLILVIVALNFGKLSAPRERVLTKFMYVGAACFVVALGATFIPLPEPRGTLQLVQELRSENAPYREALNAALSTSDTLITQLQRASQLVDRSCPGGSSGVSPANAATIIGINTTVANSIASARAAITAALSEIHQSIKN